MSRKRDPLGKSFSSIVDNQNKTDETVLEIYEKQTKEKKTMKNIKPNTQFKNIKGGIIQKTLPTISDNGSRKYYELDKIGEILRKKREDKGFSIADVSEALCYRKSTISAIESGDWDSLPHIVYVKGYVRKYSELLGIVEEIDPFMKENIQKASEPDKDEIADDYEPKKALEINFPREGIFKIPKIPKAVFFYASIILVIIGFFVFDLIYKERKITSKFENAVHVANSVTTKEENKIIPQIAETKKLMITCHERTWISVIIDGTEKKELMLKPEEVVILNAKEKFDLLVGNAGGIKIFLNGKDTDFKGEKGQVKRITIS